MFSSHARVFLLTATASMFLLPLATVFAVRDYLSPMLKLQPNMGDALAILSAVLVIQLIMLASCYVAFSEDISDSERKDKAQ